MQATSEQSRISSDTCAPGSGPGQKGADGANTDSSRSVAMKGSRVGAKMVGVKGHTRGREGASSAASGGAVSALPETASSAASGSVQIQPRVCAKTLAVGSLAKVAHARAKCLAQMGKKSKGHHCTEAEWQALQLAAPEISQDISKLGKKRRKEIARQRQKAQKGDRIQQRLGELLAQPKSRGCPPNRCGDVSDTDGAGGLSSQPLPSGANGARHKQIDLDDL